MKKYEAMFIIRPDLSEADKKTVLAQIGDAIIKNNGSLTQANIWAEKKRLQFPIKKQNEGTYYLADFSVPSEAIAKLRYIYKLNENILRVLILSAE